MMHRCNLNTPFQTVFCPSYDNILLAICFPSALARESSPLIHLVSPPFHYSRACSFSGLAITPGLHRDISGVPHLRRSPPSAILISFSLAILIFRATDFPQKVLARCDTKVAFPPLSTLEPRSVISTKFDPIKISSSRSLRVEKRSTSVGRIGCSMGSA
jgi:hypothetical protein